MPWPVGIGEDRGEFLTCGEPGIVGGRQGAEYGSGGVDVDDHRQDLGPPEGVGVAAAVRK
jgi:hypothetical protein